MMFTQGKSNETVTDFAMEGSVIHLGELFDIMDRQVNTQSIHLASNRLGPDHAQYLAVAFNKKKSIRYIDLSDNPLSVNYQS